MFCTRHIRPALFGGFLLAALASASAAPSRSLAQTTAPEIPDPELQAPDSGETTAEDGAREERCLDVRRIRRTRVIDNQTVLFYMYGGRIKRMTLLNTCYSLAFHDSFSYRTSTGRLCAGFDHIVSRAGNYCLIDRILDVTEEMEDQKKKDQKEQNDP